MLKALLAGAAALSIAAAANAETYAIQAGHLIIDAALPERSNSTVIVDNGRIARIDSGFTAPAGATVVDERGRTVMPGMTDAHVHLTSTSGQPWYNRYTKKFSVPYETTVGLTHALEMAHALLAFGQTDSALVWIGRSVARHDAEPDWNGLACDPTYDALRKDQRFIALMAPTGMRICGSQVAKAN